MQFDETQSRIIVFFGILMVMIVLELLFPARQLPTKEKSPEQSTRLLGNFGLVILSNFASRVFLPLGLAGFAIYCTEQQLGLFNLTQLPLWLTTTISILLLDITIYWQHRLFHRIPLLWQLHKVHHADVHVDVSTALRFHPFEIIISIMIKIAAIFIIGAPLMAVILFEILLSAFAIFNHANIRLPQKIEQVARYFLMTQILHRIHHSQLYKESNSNYGFSVIWWDKLFGSYTANASKPDVEIDIGLVEYPDAKQNAHFWGLLTMPFRKK
jgi:sterol desaturase/sphingolipid hydroxylase (fatty acid hydroxylase superfamily)